MKECYIVRLLSGEAERVRAYRRKRAKLGVEMSNSAALRELVLAGLEKQ